MKGPLYALGRLMGEADLAEGIETQTNIRELKATRSVAKLVGAAGLSFAGLFGYGISQYNMVEVDSNNEVVERIVETTVNTPIFVFQVGGVAAASLLVGEAVGIHRRASRRIEELEEK